MSATRTILARGLWPRRKASYGQPSSSIPVSSRSAKLPNWCSALASDVVSRRSDATNQFVTLAKSARSAAGAEPPIDVLRITVRASPETNDHEVCLTSEDGDLIARFEDGFMGMDPADLLVFPCPLHAGTEPSTAVIGRCGCGIPDCGHVEVTIERKAGVVTWRTEERPVGVSFDAGQYDAEVDRAVNDHSWEPPDRTAARRIGLGVDRGALARHGLRFSWASGRLAPQMMTVALEFTPGPYQVLVDVDWADDDVDAIVRTCIDLLATSPDTWPRVRWLPPWPGHPEPKIAGRGWRQGFDGPIPPEFESP